MHIRFCGFCDTVLRDDLTYCPKCGAQLFQKMDEETFNIPGPWPFETVSSLCLRVQGEPRTIRFDGTTSVYDLWTRLHEAYENMALYCRSKKGEMELVEFSADKCPEDFRLLEPGVILNCKHRKFSFYSYEEADPEMAEEPGKLEWSYHGSIEFDDCPPQNCCNVLGWLVATKPRPVPGHIWTYDI